MALCAQYNGAQYIPHTCPVPAERETKRDRNIEEKFIQKHRFFSAVFCCIFFCRCFHFIHLLVAMGRGGWLDWWWLVWNVLCFRQSVACSYTQKKNTHFSSICFYILSLLSVFLPAVVIICDIHNNKLFNKYNEWDRKGKEAMELVKETRIQENRMNAQQIICFQLNTCKRTHINWLFMNKL